MKKDIVNETFQKHLKLLHEHLNINEYSDPFEGQNSSDFDKIKNKLSPQQKEIIKNLDGSLYWVFTGWNDKYQTISIESIDTHEMRRSPLTIDKDGNTKNPRDDMEQIPQKYPAAKKLSIREGYNEETANYYNLLKAGKIPEKQAQKVEKLLNDDGYIVDGYKDQTVELYAPPNHGEIQHQPRFGNVVYIDKDGKIIKAPHQIPKKYPDAKKLSIRESRSQILKPKDSYDRASVFSEIMSALQSEHDVGFYNNYSERMSDFLYDEVRRGKSLIYAVQRLFGAVETDHKNFKSLENVKKQSDGSKLYAFSINGKPFCDISEENLVTIY